MSTNEASLSTLIQRVEGLSDAAGDMLAAVRESGSLEAHTRAAAEAVGGALNAHSATDKNAHAALFAAQATAFSAKIRRRLTVDTNYYVQKDGNDANDGLSASKAFLTIGRAVDELNHIDGNGFNACINIGAGTWGSVRIYADMLVGIRALYILGSGTSSSGTVLKGSRNNDMAIGICDAGPIVHIRNIRLETFSYGISVEGGAQAAVSNIYFSNVAIPSQAFRNAYLVVGSNISIEAATSPMEDVIRASRSSTVEIEGSVFAIGAPVLGSAFAYIYMDSTLILQPLATFSGAATGTRYRLDRFGRIVSNGKGSLVLPGDAAGYADASSQYY